MSDRIVSLIRTWVPVAIGAALTWLAATFGIGLDSDSSAGLTVGATALVVAVYYTVARLLESRWPWLGVLLGKPATPAYSLPPTDSSSEVEYYPDGEIKTVRSVSTWPPKA